MVMSSWVGLLACVVSVLFFGSMFVSVKKFNAGNGIFVQWVMSAAILCVGMAVNVFKGFPTFYPLVMLGGVFWAIGNATAVPIMSQLGIGMGMLIWGTTNCIMGWACGRFGLFGVNAVVPSMPLLNYLGLIFVIIGGFLFSQIRPTPSRPETIDSMEYMPINESTPIISQTIREEDGHESSHAARVNKQKKRAIGIATALGAGFLYGVTFVPVIYIQDHPSLYPGASRDGLAYVFAHYCGIFATATFIMIGYILYSGNRPFVNAQIIGPSMVAGCMWAIAQSSWFVANDNLSQTVTFPIISMVPGACAALWSVFYFKEITGRRNLKMLSMAIGITLSGAIFVGVSK